MVLPAPAPHDAPRPDEPAWLARLNGILRLVRRGVLVLVDRARPERLGELVRSLLPAHPDVEVYTSAVDLTQAEEGALAILIPDPRQATWLNLERPLFANRSLRVILFSDFETSATLARRAPDFFHWISHRLECPEGPPLPAVRGIRAALKTRAQGVAWTGGDFERTFRRALPGRTLQIVSAAIPYEQMVAASRPSGRGWVAWTDVDGPFRLRRVRWATAESGRRGRVALIAPAVDTPGFAAVHGALPGVAEARSRLRDAGAARPGRLAALLDLEGEAVELAEALLRAGVEEARLEEAVRTAPDPGVALGRMGKDEGVRAGAGILARMGERGEVEREAVEALLRGPKVTGDVWVDAAGGAIAAGDYEAAVLWGKRGVALSGESVRTLQVAGRALEGHGDYDEAAAMLRKAMEIAEKSRQTGETPTVAVMALARIMQLRGKQLEAERLLRRAVAAQKKRVGPNHANYGVVLHALAMVLHNRGRQEEAESLLKQSASILGKAVGKDHISHAIVLGDLGAVLLDRGKYGAAETQLRRSLEIVERQYGRESLEYANGLHSLGRVLLEQRKYSAAEAALRSAIAIKAKLLGTVHFSYAQSLRTLARCLIEQGEYEPAEHLLLEALSIIEKTTGTANPDYATSLNDLAGVFVYRSEHTKAEEALRRALAMEQESLGDNHPILCATLHNLAVVLSAQGHLAESEALAERSLAIAERKYGARHPDTARQLALLARLKVARHDPDAVTTATRALDAATRSLGASDPTTKSVVALLDHLRHSEADLGE